MEATTGDEVRANVDTWLREADEALESESCLSFGRHIDQIVSPYDADSGIDLSLLAYDLALSSLGGRAKELKLLLSFALSTSDDALDPSPKQPTPAPMIDELAEEIDLFTPPSLYLVRRDANRDGFGYFYTDLVEIHKRPLAVSESPAGGFVVCTYATWREAFFEPELFAAESDPFNRTIDLAHYLGFSPSHPAVPPALGSWPFPGRGFGAVFAD